MRHKILENPLLTEEELIDWYFRYLHNSPLFSLQKKGKFIKYQKASAPTDKRTELTFREVAREMVERYGH